jgi:hypothetical protein
MKKRTPKPDQKPRTTIDVNIVFRGVVTVEVPGHLDKKDARLLASKLALAKALATTDNPDAPEEDAFEEYAEKCTRKETVERDWDSAAIHGIGGQWSIAKKGVMARRKHGGLMSQRELATVLAALRYWQHDLAENEEDGPISPEHFDENITPLSVEEIDGLCERLNFDSASS